MKLILILIPILLVLSFNTRVFSQGMNDEKIIIVVPFFAENSQYQAAAEQVNGYAMHEFVSSKRARFVEREQFSQIELEKMRQAGDDFDPRGMIELDNAIGGTHMLIGKISSCDVQQKYTDKGDVYYTCDLRTMIRMVNIETGEIEATDTWESGGLFSHGKTEEAVISQSAKGQKKDAEKFLETYFPLKGRIKKAISEEEFIIDLGSSDGIQTKDLLEVYSIEDLDGEKFHTHLATLKVTAVNGPTLCTATLKNTERGQSKDCVTQALNNRTNLIVKTKQ